MMFTLKFLKPRSLLLLFHQYFLKQQLFFFLKKPLSFWPSSLEVFLTERIQSKSFQLRTYNFQNNETCNLKGNWLTLVSSFYLFIKIIIILLHVVSLTIVEP